MRLFVIAFGICLSSAITMAAYTVVYDTTTNNVLEYGFYGADVKKGDPAYGITAVSESDPILKNLVSELRYDPNTKTVIKKPTNEITSNKNATRKKEILNTLWFFYAQVSSYNAMIADGIDASKELAATQAQITALKAEYLLIP